MSATPAIRASAIRDLHQAAKWYEAESEGLGEAFVQEVDQAITAACLMPLRFPKLHRDIRRSLVKRFPFGVYFRHDAESDELIVLAIMHLRRAPKRWRVREE